MTPTYVPSRADVRDQLRRLLAGSASREAVATWASTWVVTEPHPRVDDPLVWRALKQLCGADLLSQPDEYLHDEADFRRWLEPLDEAPADHQRPDAG